MIMEKSNNITVIISQLFDNENIKFEGEYENGKKMEFK